MPYKNCAVFLDETITSIINQTYKNWELIAVNDNSEDNSENVLLKYKGSRIKTIKNNKTGIIEALKTGFKLSKGKYITRMDADDISLPNKLEELINAITKYSKNTVAIGLVKYFKSNGEKIGNGYLNYQNWINSLAKNNKSFTEIYKECPIPSPSWLMLKKEFEKIGGFNSKIYPEDYDLAFRMYKHNLKLVSTKNIVHLWRDYPTRTSRTNKNYKDNKFINIKIKYFLEIDRNKDKPLIVLGAGKKGKSIAKTLISKNIQFDWLCGIKSKIGHNIYGKTLKNSNNIPNNSQIIVAIAIKKELTKIKKSEHKNNKYYYFC